MVALEPDHGLLEITAVVEEEVERLIQKIGIGNGVSVSSPAEAVGLRAPTEIST